MITQSAARPPSPSLRSSSGVVVGQVKFPGMLVVRASPIHGKGLFACRSLPERRKMGEISGRLVKLPEGRKAIERHPVIYLVELSRRYALDCSNGNFFRHLNHSCQPNCYLRIIRRRVEVYTSRRIPSGEELTVDYGQTQHKGGMICGCGSPKCKERI